MSIFSNNLKWLRNLKGLTLDELSKCVNKQFDVSINKGMLSKWENEKGEPSLQYAIILANFFNVTVDFLIGVNSKNEIGYSSIEEKQLLDNYNKLNDLGKKEANKRVSELTEISKYILDTKKDTLDTKKDTYEVPITIAAHDDNLTDDEKDEMNRRIEEFEKNLNK